MNLSYIYSNVWVLDMYFPHWESLNYGVPREGYRILTEALKQKHKE